MNLVESKVEGKEITALGPQVQRTQVIDLMDALKQSLEARATKDGGDAGKKPAVKAKRAGAESKTSETRTRKTASK